MPGVAESLALYFAIMIGTMAAGLPIAPATLIVAKVAAPWLVAAVAALAAALIAVGDYALVRRAFRTRALDRVRRSAIFAKVERWARLAPFLTTLLFAALPMPFVIVRVLVPVSGYPLARYVAAVSLGRYARVFALAAFGYGGYFVVRTILHGADVPGFPSLMVMMLLLGGLQLLSLGVIGEYLGRVYDEVKARPLYIVRQRIGFDADESGR